MFSFERQSQRQSPTPESERTQNEKLISKVQDIAERQPSEINESDLDGLVSQSSKIEGDPHIQEVYALLVDLRVALFRPELSHLVADTSVEELLAKLRKAAR